MADMIRAIVTDIEGTTTPITFVTETLFPYAKQALPGFIRLHRHEPAVAALLADVRDLAGEPALGDDELAAILLGWIDEDRKITPLKTLQGLIWAEGYATGAFHGALYDDVPDALRRWHKAGIRLFGYSSGSEAAQRLLFRHSSHGDLTALFEGFFDTRIGGKLLPASYSKLADIIGLPAGDLMFLSDHPGELDAAQEAGWSVAALDRDRTGSSGRHRGLADFAAIEA